MIKIKTVFNKKIHVCISLIDLVHTLSRAIEDRRKGNFVPPFEAHERIKKIYTWRNVAKRTEIVYNMVMNDVPKDSGDRLSRFDWP